MYTICSRIRPPSAKKPSKFSSPFGKFEPKIDDNYFGATRPAPLKLKFDLAFFRCGFCRPPSHPRLKGKI